jgi:eukaryotic-like serine/threonine-protein kinase
MFPADRRRYRLDPKPLGAGGYAEVFRAEEKDTGRVVAFKRARDRHGDGPTRLRREVNAMVALREHLNVMDVLDADERHQWYVMPLADGDLDKLNASLPADGLVDALSQVAEGLRAAHDLGLIHRDVTPKNILYFSDDARWVVADWGLVRGPRGRTSDKLTRTGVVLGTEGFIAPEVLRDAHRAATPAADVYSLGRVAAWATTGTWPLAGETLLPDGPWRSLVRHATRADSEARPTLEEFVSDMQEVTYLPPGHAADRAAELARAAQTSDTAAGQLLDHADAHRDHAAIFFDHLPRVTGSPLARLADDPPHAARLVDAMREHLCADDDRWGRRSFDAVNRPLTWLRAVALAAEGEGQLGVLEDAAEALFVAGPVWRRFPERRATRSWLAALDAEVAQTVARALRRHAAARDWLREEGWRPPSRTHPAIRSALGF